MRMSALLMALVAPKCQEVLKAQGTPQKKVCPALADVLAIADDIQCNSFASAKR